MIGLAVCVLGLVVLWFFQANLRRIANTAPKISTLAEATVADLASPEQNSSTQTPKISVVIPAYNEADNISACITSVLNSTKLPLEQLEVWVVDDQSSDRTFAIVQSLQATLNDPRLKLLAGQSRPDQQVWMGKNWACTQATRQANGNFLLFLDADVRLKPGAIATALDVMQREQIDLLTCCPAIVCGCLAEWLVQPLIVSLLIAGSEFSRVNDPSSETAFAVGPFMLFRRTAYEQVGGHQAVANQVVEDVELARRVKQQQLKLKYALGHDLAAVQMYESWSALWEGWTKNWYLGSRRNLPITVYSAVIMFLSCTVPWLGLAFLLTKGGTTGLTTVDLITSAVVVASILLQVRLRQTIASLSTISPRYWWLTPVGGVLVAAIALASIIKTETGWGWTWRGRSLQLPDQPSPDV